MKRDEVLVVPYDSHWASAYAEEAEKIAKALEEPLLAIHHIGSTAVPSLSAKPIIDIMGIVTDLAEVDRRKDALLALGYEYMGEFGIAGRRYLRKRIGNKRTHHVHIFQKDDRFSIERHLAVRDYLRAHEDEAKRYAALKQALAVRYPNDLGAYCDGKDAFMKELERKALKWQHAQKMKNEQKTGENDSDTW